MAVVIINPVGMTQYFGPDTGPWGRWLDRKAQVVLERAKENASGPVIDTVTGELLASVQKHVIGSPAGAFAGVFTDAIHRGWAYGGVVTRGANGTGDPGGWLIEALTDIFPISHS